LTLTILIVITILLAGCGGAPAAPPREAPAQEVEVQAPPQEPTAKPQEEPPADQEAALAPTPVIVNEDGQSDEYTLTSLPSRPNRLIVKDAELKLLVSDTDAAIDRTTQVVADCAGYIISSRVWYEEWLGENYKYASITIGIPVDQFERAMRRLRNMALQVVDETAAGQDVTDEYVDLQSRLGNLEATRDRIREFLNQAQTVEESLRVNEELAAIEEQIEQVQGRMNYLFDRAAYSTITIQINPDLPQPTPTPIPPTPTPAPSPTPTPEPTPTPPWSPADTVQQAGNTLTTTLRIVLRIVTELVIWFGMVILPLFGPPALIIWLIARWGKRRREKRQRPTP
jgi:hypothetical protein